MTSPSPSAVGPLKITVVTPSYRQLEWLKLAMASVNDQEGAEVEHLIQDAGTGPELEAWVRAHGGRSRLFVEPDSGMYNAINRGFQKATGDILAWLNCDEQYLPGALARVETFFRAHPAVDVLFGDAVLLDERGKLLSYRRAVLPSRLHLRLSHLATLSCATFARRSVLERGLRLQEQWKAIADQVWVADLLQAKIRMAVLPEALAAFTFTSGNLSQRRLAFEEGERWQKQTLPPGLMALKPAAVALHRFRKLLHGAYRRRDFSTAIYTRATGTQRRVTVATPRLSFGWK